MENNNTFIVSIEGLKKDPAYRNAVKQVIHIDNFRLSKELCVVHTVKNAMIFPGLSAFFNVPDSKVFNTFIVTPKRCYNSDELRNHMCDYINYFCFFYDTNKEYLFYLYRMKNLIDNGIDKAGTKYTLEMFQSDIKNYILSESMYDKVWELVQHEYMLNLTYKNKNNEALQYNNIHGMYFMEISIFQNLIIPLMMHFIYKNGIKTTQIIDKIILETYNMIIEHYDDQQAMERRGLPMVDMFNKVYETASTSMQRDYINNQTIWDICKIRGYDPLINANDAINTIIMQLMPKYRFSGNMVMCNITGVRKNIEYNIEIAFEYDYAPMSSSKRDGEDSSSQMDNFESYMIKTDESLIIQNDFRYEKVMKNILAGFDPITDEEIKFYRNEMTKNGTPIMQRFQQNLVFNMFYKDFGDTVSINSINIDDYIRLIICAKRKLLGFNMRLLPYIISSNIIRLSQRTSLCKRELVKLESSMHYKSIIEKYNGNEKVLKTLSSLIASILSSSFEAIDYDNPKINGLTVVTDPDILIDEILIYILQV